MLTVNPKHTELDELMKKVFLIWENYTGGSVTVEEDGSVFLDTYEDTYYYNNKKEAVDECLYTISQWLMS